MRFVMGLRVLREGLRTNLRQRITQSLFALVLLLGASVCLNSRDVRVQTGAQEKQKETKIQGKVCNAAGEAIAGATLWLERDVDTSALEAVTDADGKYAFVVPGGGRFRLKVMKHGFRDVGVESIELSDSGSKHLDVILEKENSKADANAEASGKAMEFSDEPNFTVAGVMDWSNAGLHGSDANVRTSEALAKDMAALKASTSGEKSPKASDADAHRLSGDAKERSGDPVGAVNEYEKAVKLDASEESYFAWGAELLRHRAGVAAVEVFKKGAQAHAKSARMLAGLGAAYYADGQHSEGAEQMCAASDLNPKDSGPYLFLGKMEQASTELLPCSETRLARFASEQPENALASYYYGLVLWKKGRRVQSAEEVRRAEALFKKAIAINPAFGDAYLQLGIMYNAGGEKDAALRNFQKAVAASPQLSAAHYQLSLAYRRMGETEKAELEMNVYDALHKKEDAALEKERREMRQFVTILKDRQTAQPK